MSTKINKKQNRTESPASLDAEMAPPREVICGACGNPAYTIASTVFCDYCEMLGQMHYEIEQ